MARCLKISYDQPEHYFIVRLCGVWEVSQDRANLEKDIRILETLRKTLAQVVKEITPADSSVGMPLEPSTLDDVHMCFDLISAREHEITLAIKQQDKEAKKQL